MYCSFENQWRTDGFQLDTFSLLKTYGIGLSFNLIVFSWEGHLHTEHNKLQIFFCFDVDINCYGVDQRRDCNLPRYSYTWTTLCFVQFQESDCELHDQIQGAETRALVICHVDIIEFLHHIKPCIDCKDWFIKVLLSTNYTILMMTSKIFINWFHD